MISSNEYIRKIIHLFSLIIPFGYLYIITDKYVMVQILIVLNIIFLFFDITRHRIVWIQSIFKYFIIKTFTGCLIGEVSQNKYLIKLLKLSNVSTGKKSAEFAVLYFCIKSIC